MIIILQIKKPLPLLDGTANHLSLRVCVAERGEEGDGRESDCEDVFDLDLGWECLDLGPPVLGRSCLVRRSSEGAAQRRPITRPIRGSSIQVSTVL